jgi:hypothetical protein
MSSSHHRRSSRALNYWTQERPSPNLPTVPLRVKHYRMRYRLRTLLIGLPFAMLAVFFGYALYDGGWNDIWRYLTKYAFDLSW